MARGGSSWARRQNRRGTSAAAFGASFSNPVREPAPTRPAGPADTTPVVAYDPTRLPRHAALPVVFFLVSLPPGATFVREMPAGIIETTGELVSEVA